MVPSISICSSFAMRPLVVFEGGMVPSKEKSELPGALEHAPVVTAG